MTGIDRYGNKPCLAHGANSIERASLFTHPPHPAESFKGEPVAISIFLTAFAGLTLAFPADGGSEERPSMAPAVVEARVTADGLDVLDRPKATGYVVAGLKQGDRVRIRWQEPAPTGWLAIEPPPSVVCWIEEAAVERPEDAGPADHVAVGARTRVRAAQAVVRAGNLRARLPGPPCRTLERGDPVLLVDRPALTFGKGGRWVAIAPASDLCFFARADGIGWDRPTSPPAPPPATEVRAGYEEPAGTATTADADLRRIDGMLRAIVTGQPVENWRLGDVRAGYESLLKSRPDLEDAVKSRLEQLARYERASKAAQRFIEIVSKSRRRDQEVAKAERKITSAAEASQKLYDAVGFVQPSSRKVNGRKVYALIGREGMAVAYLDIPPGLDPGPLLAHRVGVRGRARFNGDLGTRVIAVSDLENLEPRR